MGRRHRRIAFRLGVAAGALCVGAIVAHRWRLRKASASITVAIPEEWAVLSPSERRWRHRKRFAQSIGGSNVSSLDESGGSPTQQQPFDVLVVGGGVTGLYTAVDAAQRGLKVALLEASDFGGGATATQPALTPGAFPLVQRAIRQRDARWLWRAYHTLENATVWCNTAPHCMGLGTNTTGEHPREAAATAAAPAVTHARTLTPALHMAELLELSVTAWLSTFLSVFAGPIRLCGVLKSSSPVRQQLPRLLGNGCPAEGGGGGAVACGGVVSHDFLLDGSKAALCLARTAEALGVTILNYAEVVSVDHEGSSPRCRGTAKARSTSTSPSLVVATVCDHASPPGLPSVFQLCTRGVINCAGAGVDAVRAQIAGNSRDAVPAAFDRFHLYTYLVVPRRALFHVGVKGGSRKEGEGSRSFADAWRGKRDDEDAGSFLWLTKPGNAIQVTSTQYSFSTMLVMPWHDDTLLLGPSITPLAVGPQQLNRRRDALTPGNKTRSPDGGGGGDGDGGGLSLAFAVRSRDALESQKEHILAALDTCGIGVHRDQVLSYLSTVVPLVGNPPLRSFAEDLLVKGYHIHTCVSGDGAGTESSATGGRPEGAGGKAKRAPPFVHVYGGTALASRRIAEEAVDAFLQKTTALQGDGTGGAPSAALSHSSTRWLRLAALPYDAGVGNDSDGTASATLNRMLRDAYVVRLSDVLFRRLHVAYTSPADAVQALPGLSKHVGATLKWSAEECEGEASLTKASVEGIAA